MPKAGLTAYLAAENTFLAWMRTGIALMGFGFVVARFGLFLERLQFLDAAQSVSTGFSLWFGTALIAAGIAVNVGAAWQHVGLVRQLDRGDFEGSRSLSLSLASAIFLAIVGLAMAAYLISVRHSTNSHSQNTKEINMTTGTSQVPTARNGIVSRPSNHSVDETVAKLKSILEAKGVKLFAVVDHSGEAEKAGLQMPNTKLLIFGNPKAGTPLMLAAPSLALDLPLKILVAEDAPGKTRISYNSPEYLRERHNVPQEMLANIAVIEALAQKAAE
jgi:uncharacterized protein (DUF302 family)/uncharacterized membrane protein YidH (DUF202 family)